MTPPSSPDDPEDLAPLSVHVIRNVDGKPAAPQPAPSSAPDARPLANRVEDWGKPAPAFEPPAAQAQPPAPQVAKPAEEPKKDLAQTRVVSTYEPELAVPLEESRHDLGKTHSMPVHFKPPPEARRTDKPPEVDGNNGADATEDGADPTDKHQLPPQLAGKSHSHPEVPAVGHGVDRADTDKHRYADGDATDKHRYPRDLHPPFPQEPASHGVFARPSAPRGSEFGLRQTIRDEERTELEARRSRPPGSRIPSPKQLGYVEEDAISEPPPPMESAIPAPPARGPQSMSSVPPPPAPNQETVMEAWQNYSKHRSSQPPAGQSAAHASLSALAAQVRDGSSAPAPPAGSVELSAPPKNLSPLAQSALEISAPDDDGGASVGGEGNEEPTWRGSKEKQASGAEPIAPTDAPMAPTDEPASAQPSNRRLIPADEYAPGRVIDQRYELMEELGKGGHGIVFAAKDLHLGGVVALKFLLPEVAENPELQTRLGREAHAMGALSGTCAVHILGFHKSTEGQFYLVMEKLTGHNLAHHINDWEESRGRIPLWEIRSLMEPIVETLAYAHKRGLIHRDLKPGNVFVLNTTSRGRVRLLDFGLVKMIDAGPLTLEGIVVGSPSYMAPETWRGKVSEISPLVDVYSLGAILYRMLAGRPPFEAESPMEVLIMATTAPRPKLSQYRRDLDPAIDDWVEHTLAADRLARFQSIDVMWNVLCQVLDRTPDAY